MYDIDLISMQCAYAWPIEVEGGQDAHSLPKFPRDVGEEAPTGDQFLDRPTASDELKEKNLSMAEVFMRVREAGVPNFRGAKIELDSALNISLWEATEHIHGDKNLSKMLRYGFPSGHLGHVIPTVNLKNHASSLRNPDSVKRYLNKEMRLGAMAGLLHKRLSSRGLGQILCSRDQKETRMSVE